MKRIAVIGCGGSGKSIFARRLGDALHLPVVHLDRHFWKAGWVPTPADQWRRLVDELAREPRWVMDGNYKSTFDLRLPRADTIVFLDLPCHVCLWRAVKRRLLWRGRSRPDVATGCPEKAIDWAFFTWIWTFRDQVRPAMLALLQDLSSGRRLEVLTSTRDVESFLHSLTGPVPSPTIRRGDTEEA